MMACLRIRQIAQWLVLVMLLAACSHSRHVQVSESRALPAGKAQSVPDYYIVERGDTLFSIAWRFDMDFRKLAAANQIKSPYLIHPGDRIRLSETRQATASTAVKPAKLPAGKASDTVSPAVSRAPSKVQKPVRPVVQPPVVKAVPNEAWIWPVSGKLERYFSAAGLSKGIDIAAPAGTPVKAVRSGQVVYAGSRLKGYGQLIIIRHDSEYLSAYAHNRRMLVKEGQKVSQGDVIAELGSTGTDKPRLHFEIRRNGKPVDPLGLLPKQ